MSLHVRLHPFSPHLHIVFGQTPRTHLEGKVGHRAVSFAKEASSEHVLLPGKDLLRCDLPLARIVMGIQESLAAQDSVNVTQLDEFSKWQVFIPKEEKPALRYLILGN